MNTAPLDFDTTVAAARAIVRKKSPWFWPLLSKAVIKADPGVETASVSINVVIRMNPTWILSMPLAKVCGLVVHELLHRVLKHAERVGLRLRDVWGIAGDRVINGMVVSMGYEIPDGGITPQNTLPNEGTDLTTEEAYELLLKDGKGGGGGSGDSGSDGGDGSGTPQTGYKVGKCGSGAGNPLPGDDEADADDGQLASVVEQAVDETLKEAAIAGGRNPGSVPAALRRQIEALLTPPRVPWQRLLGQAVRRCVQWRPGATHLRYDAPSRRQGGIGYGAGKPVLARLRQAVPRVVVGWDTSGSMRGSVQNMIAAELKGLLSAVQADVHVFVCDAAIHGAKACRNIKDAVALANNGGGGGTDFRPVFEAAGKLKDGCDLFIYATDLYGAFPAAPPTYPVIWLVPPDGAHSAPFGQVIHIEQDQ